MLKDKYGRTFSTLRLSLTSVCNFACTYCVPENHKNVIDDSAAALSISQILDHVQRIHKETPLESVRLTGGEPLLYNGLEEVIQGLNAMGIQNIKMTSNAFLLKQKAFELRSAGLSEINISLDAIDEDVFAAVTKRYALKRVLEGIDEAGRVGIKVKLNAVIKKGENDSQILPLLSYARKKGLIIRFLEVMQMGHLYETEDDTLVTQDEILTEISRQFRIHKLPRKASSTANYWKTNTGQIFGIIANESSPFCHDCNRLRMDEKGRLYGCLSNENGIALEATDDEFDLKRKLKKALRQKQPVRFSGSNISMIDIGG